MKVKWPYVWMDLAAISLLVLVIALGVFGFVPWWLSLGYLLYSTQYNVAFKIPFAKGDSVRELRKKYEQNAEQTVNHLLNVRESIARLN